jgi:hypothetical protein
MNKVAIPLRDNNVRERLLLGVDVAMAHSKVVLAVLVNVVAMVVLVAVVLKALKIQSVANGKKKLFKFAA